jgi:hypothetical membrane protein
MFKLIIILTAVLISLLSVSAIFYNLVGVFSKNKTLKCSIAFIVLTLFSVFLYFSEIKYLL